MSAAPVNADTLSGLLAMVVEVDTVPIPDVPEAVRAAIAAGPDAGRSGS